MSNSVVFRSSDCGQIRIERIPSRRASAQATGTEDGLRATQRIPIYIKYILSTIIQAHMKAATYQQKDSRYIVIALGRRVAVAVMCARERSIQIVCRDGQKFVNRQRNFWDFGQAAEHR